MKLSYKVAAAFFCSAAGVSVATALPNLTAALAVGIALLLIGTILAAVSIRQAAQCFREMCREEQEQLKQNLAVLQESIKQLDTRLTTSTERLYSSQKSGQQDIREGMDEMISGLKQLSGIENEVKKIVEAGVVSAQQYDAGNKARLEQLGETITMNTERLRSSQKNDLKWVRESIDDVASKVDDLNDTLENKLDELADRVDDQTEQLEQLNARTGNIQEQGLEEVKAEVGSMREKLEAQLDRTDAAVSAFRTSAEELGKGLELFHQKTEAALNSADKAAQTQLQALQTFLKEENRENRDSTERIMQTYAYLSEQDTRLLSALEPKGGK